MAVHIRLLRMGAKKRAFYRIVATDSRMPRDGRNLEIIGTYNPITKPAVVNLQEDKITKWLNEGAVPSHTVKSLFRQIGFNEKYEKAKRGEDVSGIELRTTIKERPKKTRKVKKAVIAAAEAAEKEVAEKAKAKEEAAAAKAKEKEEAEAAKAKAAEEAAAAKEAEATKTEESAEGDKPSE